MKFLIALLALASLSRADVSHLQPSRNVNYAGLNAMAQGPSNPQGFQYNFQYKGGQFPEQVHSEVIDCAGNAQMSHSFVDSKGIVRSGQYTVDGNGLHQSQMNYYNVLRQPEDSRDVRREKEQFARIADRNRALHEFIADSNFRAQVQAYNQAYAPYHNNNQAYAPYRNNQAYAPYYHNYNQPQNTYEVSRANDRHAYLYQKIAAEHAAIGAQRAAGHSG